MSILVGIIRQHIRNWMDPIFDLIVELWDQPGIHLSLVSLVEAIGKVMDAEFKPYLPKMIPLVLRAFEGEVTDKKMEVQTKILDAFQTFGTNIEEYLHLVIPIIVKSYERLDGSLVLRKKAIQTIEVLSKRVNFSDHASRIVHPVRVLESSGVELRMSAMDALCALVTQLGSDFAIFVPTINKVCRAFLWSFFPPNFTPILTFFF
jgi:FKBP12-rapamycin complex-associated protein